MGNLDRFLAPEQGLTGENAAGFKARLLIGFRRRGERCVEGEGAWFDHFQMIIILICEVKTISLMR
jgi:hypothetical protein